MTKQCELTGIKISLGNNVSHAHNKTKRNSDFFDKYELKKILDLYAQMVSNGIWKDYK